MGLVSGMVALAVMALAAAWGIYKPRAKLAPMALIALMIAFTVHSPFGIIPAMERDRIAAGGSIDATSTLTTRPSRISTSCIIGAWLLRRRFCCWGW